MASPNSSMTVTMSDHDDGNSVKYKGVRKRKWGKWVSEIRLPNSRERIWLGSYDSAEKAARAFDAALFCLRGDRANFNFSDTPFLFHLPSHQQSLTHHQIQLLASSFANQFNHQQLRMPPPKETPHEEEEAEFHSVCPVSLSEETNTNGGYNSNSSTCTSSSSSSCNNVRVVEEDEGTIDWSFLNSLDYYSNDAFAGAAAASIDYCGLYTAELDYFGQFGESATSSELSFDYNAHESHYEDDDTYNSHNYSFLWNFGHEGS